jgi:two-component system sensor histidine kinase KdpD
VVSVGAVSVTAALCLPLAHTLGYQSVALILLAVVCLLALVVDTWPMVVAAVFSAMLWNFLFIQPTFTLHIGTVHDVLLFIMYFVVVLVSAVLTTRLRRSEAQVLQSEADEETLRLYGTVLNSLSHELRTPLSTLVGGIDAMQQQELAPPDRQKLLASMGDAADRLNRQVGMLLDMSRLESGNLRPRNDWCDLSEILNDVAHELEPLARTHQIAVHAPEMVMARTDEGLVRQVVQNLVRNAMVHTPAGTAITLRGVRMDDRCVIEVEDDGPGIAEAESLSVFSKFYRAKGSSPGGLGLGLAIAKGFAEALGGQLLLSRGHNGGARFTLQLPDATSRPATATP